MKRVYAMILVIAAMCMAFTANAEIKVDALNQMSYEELATLRDEIDSRMKRMEEENKWISGEPVTLEPGVYEVGVDIPEGEWTIRPVDGSNTSVEYTTKIDEEKQRSVWNGFISGAILSTKEGETKYEAECMWDLTKGTYLVIELRPAILSK